MTQEALKLALEALKMYGKRHRATYLLGGAWDEEITLGDKAITAIKEALAQPEQEPVAMVESVATVVSESGNQEVTMSWWHEPALPVGTKLYTTPPQRKPLTDEEFDKLLGPFPRYAEEWSMTDFIRFARAIEAAHGIKENT